MGPEDRVEVKLEDQLESVELLGEPVRRALYLHVARQPAEVSRDEAAAAVKVSRELAAFHLDKLVNARLLEPVYRRLTGRTGPGAGRPAKLYRRARGEVSINLPPREYQLASRVFARALGLDAAQPPPEELRDAARGLGHEIGCEARDHELLPVLEAYGYEPFVVDGVVRLCNCPFHALALDFREPVCAMNLALLEGVLEGVREGAGSDSLTAELDPQDGFCCVAFRGRRI